MTGGLIAAGAVQLYTEFRQTDKPPIILIAGGGADGDLFDTMLEPLCAEFSVLTYDRRGSSRSPHPTGWTSTSIEEQTDDLASLFAAVGLESARIFGTSWGAPIALDLALRYRQLVQGVVIHEAPLFHGLPDFAEITERRRKLTEAAVASDDYEQAFRTLVQANNGEVFDYMDGTLRDRLTANARTFFNIELPGFADYAPTPSALTSVRDVGFVCAGEGNRESAIYAATAQLATQIGVELVELPGGHAPYLDRQPGPTEFGTALTELLVTAGESR